MSPPRILYELYNLTIAGGTGIATYARNLCAVAAELGYDVEGLLHSWRRIDPRDPLLAEIGFFDARNRKLTLAEKALSMTPGWVAGVPFGLSATPIPNSHVVIQPNADATLSRLKQIYAATLFMDMTRFHFNRWGTAAQLRLPRAPDIFHATQAIPLYVPGAKNIYTIHDIVPLRLPYSTLDDKKFFLNMTRRLGRIADRIVTVSESSRQDLVRFCGMPEEKVVNTYQAVSFPADVMGQTREEAARLVRHAFDLEPGDYYFFYGAIEPKKNLGRLVDAFVASGSQRRLVVAGGLGWEYQADLEKLEDARTRELRISGDRIAPHERVRRLHHLPLFQLTALIRCARAVVFPSLYEGFGLPVLESMLLGAPVLTSNVASLREVAGEAALLVEPTEIRSIMGAIQKLDADDALCADLSARGAQQAEKFSPAAYKARLAKVYDDALGRR